MTHRRLYSMIVLIGLLPTIAVFIWGINRALQTKSEQIVPVFSKMQ